MTSLIPALPPNLPHGYTSNYGVFRPLNPVVTTNFLYYIDYQRWVVIALGILTNAFVYDVGDCVARPQAMWVKYGIAGIWILSYKLQGFSI